MGNDAAEQSAAGARTPAYVPLANLLLDTGNPRFGGSQGVERSQAEIVDYIVDTFGVDDVLSSLAVNGYFEAEPLVCRPAGNGTDFIVTEGNRRLTACLILAGDARAERQAPRAKLFQKVWDKHGKRPIDPLPAIIFTKDEDKKALLSYLGVRHISAAQPWDSYAKAAWVARVVEENSLSLDDVIAMIGDQHRTIPRLMEGYYFIEQAVGQKQYDPENSVPRGRGSNTKYPFSWVYTLLGYSAVRNYLGIGEGPPQSNPISEANLPRAGIVLRALFGDRSKGRNAAISDSRQIGDLANLFLNPDDVAMLEAGKTVSEILRQTRPVEQQVRDALTEVRALHVEVVRAMAERSLPASVAAGLVDLAGVNRRAATEIEKNIREAALGTADE